MNQGSAVTPNAPPKRRLHEIGEEPDPRFTLANERTFLAWIRTALGLLAAGLAVAELLKSEPRDERLLLAVPLVVLAGVIGFFSHRRWRTLELALRLREPLPPARLGAALGAAIGCSTIAAVIVLVTG